MNERIRLIETLKLKDQMFDRSELSENIESLCGGTKQEILISLLKTISKNYRSPILSSEILRILEGLRNAGIDYPEFNAIEKSMKGNC